MKCQNEVKIAFIPLRTAKKRFRSEINAIGMQIDLLIDRADDAVNVCEMKFYKAPYAVTKGYAQVLNSRLQALEEKNPTKTFLLTYVGNSELVSNEYSDIFRASVTLDDLFI